MLHTYRDFKAMIPRRDARLLPEGVAQLVRNLKLWSGAIRPIGGLGYVNAPYYGPETLAFYRYSNANLDYWFNWNRRVDVAPGPVSGDTLNRLYWTDGVKPKKTGNDIGLMTAGVYPSNYYFMGVKQPGGAPTQATQAAGSASTTHVRGYVAVYETGWGEFSTPSLPVETGTINTDATIRVTKFVESPDALYNITHWRLYRTATGASGDTDYFYVGRATIATAYIDDSLAVSALAEALEQPYNDEPPAAMQGLLALPNGMMAGFDGKNICFCKPYLPHAWPIEYQYAMDKDVVAIGRHPQGVIAGTKGQPQALVGVDPANITVLPLLDRQTCRSKESMAAGLTGPVFASPMGLFLAGIPQGQVVTRSIMTGDEWKDLDPATIAGEIHDGRYYGSHISKGSGVRQGFIFDPAEPDDLFSEFDVQTLVMYSDVETDLLYVLVDGKIYAWDNNQQTRLLGFYRSGIKLLPAATNFQVVQVKGNFAVVIIGAALDAYNAAKGEIVAFNEALTDPVPDYAGEWGESFGEMPFGGDGMMPYPAGLFGPPIFRLYDGKGNLLDTREIPSEVPVTLSSGQEHSEFYWEIETHVDIQEVRLAELQSDLPGD